MLIFNHNCVKRVERFFSFSFFQMALERSIMQIYLNFTAGLCLLARVCRPVCVAHDHLIWLGAKDNVRLSGLLTIVIAFPFISQHCHVEIVWNFTCDGKMVISSAQWKPKTLNLATLRYRLWSAPSTFESNELRTQNANIFIIICPAPKNEKIKRSFRTLTTPAHAHNVCFLVCALLSSFFFVSLFQQFSGKTVEKAIRL